MPRGVYKHHPHQGFQPGTSPWTGRKLTDAHKAKLHKPKSRPSHFKGKTYAEIYGTEWKRQIDKRRSGRIAYHDRKGRVSRFRRPRHWGTAYRLFTRRILERDGFRCVLCHSTSKLEVDHYPHSFAELCQAHGVTTAAAAELCTALWDMRNGRTLCSACHRKTATYGKHLDAQKTKTQT